MTPRDSIAPILAFAALMLTGCASQSGPPPVSIAPEAGTPHLVNNLSSLSAVPISPLATGPEGAAALIQPAGGNAAAARTFEETPGLMRQAGSGAAPGEERLLNTKAAQFANFSQTLLDRIYAQLALLETTEEFARIRVPTDVRPVIITAIMDKSGKLRELIVERHSGKADIDKLFIDASKRGVWYRNPPRAALSGNGDYRLTIEGGIENFASQDQIHWSFKTSLGLGIE